MEVSSYLEFEVKSLVMSFSLTVGASIEESNNDERKRAPSEEKKLKLEKSLISSMKPLQEVPPSMNLLIHMSQRCSPVTNIYAVW
jgi:hypothetical protein